MNKNPTGQAFTASGRAYPRIVAHVPDGCRGKLELRPDGHLHIAIGPAALIAGRSVEVAEVIAANPNGVLPGLLEGHLGGRGALDFRQWVLGFAELHRSWWSGVLEPRDVDCSLG